MQPRPTAWAWAPGTWGEFIQGEIRPGHRVLVSVPSTLGSRATVTVRERKRGTPQVVGCLGRTKARRAVQMLLDALDEGAVQVELTIRSMLPLGVGRASSSADVLSALQATCTALGRPQSARALCGFAARVEPTNPTLIPGACLFDPDGGRAMGQRPLPRLRVRPLGFGAPVDTVRSRATSLDWTRCQRRDINAILAMATAALDAGSPALLARASTRSALLMAERTGRTDIGLAWAKARRCGALGIAASHSGTSIVALHPLDDREVACG